MIQWFNLLVAVTALAGACSGLLIIVAALSIGLYIALKKIRRLKAKIDDKKLTDFTAGVQANSQLVQGMAYVDQPVIRHDDTEYAAVVSEEYMDPTDKDLEPSFTTANTYASPELSSKVRSHTVKLQPSSSFDSKKDLRFSWRN